MTAQKTAGELNMNKEFRKIISFTMPERIFKKLQTNYLNFHFKQYITCMNF